MIAQTAREHNRAVVKHLMDHMHSPYQIINQLLCLLENPTFSRSPSSVFLRYNLALLFYQCGQYNRVVTLLSPCVGSKDCMTLIFKTNWTFCLQLHLLLLAVQLKIGDEDQCTSLFSQISHFQNPVTPVDSEQSQHIFCCHRIARYLFSCLHPNIHQITHRDFDNITSMISVKCNSQASQSLLPLLLAREALMNKDYVKSLTILKASLRNVLPQHRQMYLNNIGVIHMALNQYAIASIWFCQALNDSDEVYKSNIQIFEGKNIKSVDLQKPNRLSEDQDGSYSPHLRNAFTMESLYSSFEKIKTHPQLLSETHRGLIAFNLGCALLMMRLYEEAFFCLKEAVLCLPRSAEIWIKLSECCIISTEKRKAAERQEQVLRAEEMRRMRHNQLMKRKKNAIFPENIEQSEGDKHRNLKTADKHISSSSSTSSATSSTSSTTVTQPSSLNPSPLAFTDLLPVPSGNMHLSTAEQEYLKSEAQRGYICSESEVKKGVGISKQGLLHYPSFPHESAPSSSHNCFHCSEKLDNSPQSQDQHMQQIETASSPAPLLTSSPQASSSFSAHLSSDAFQASASTNSFFTDFLSHHPFFARPSCLPHSSVSFSSLQTSPAPLSSSPSISSASSAASSSLSLFSSSLSRSTATSSSAHNSSSPNTSFSDSTLPSLDAPSPLFPSVPVYSFPLGAYEYSRWLFATSIFPTTHLDHPQHPKGPVEMNEITLKELRDAKDEEYNTTTTNNKENGDANAKEEGEEDKANNKDKGKEEKDMDDANKTTDAQDRSNEAGEEKKKNKSGKEKTGPVDSSDSSRTALSPSNSPSPSPSTASSSSITSTTSTTSSSSSSSFSSASSNHSTLCSQSALLSGDISLSFASACLETALSLTEQNVLEKKDHSNRILQNLRTISEKGKGLNQQILSLVTELKEKEKEKQAAKKGKEKEKESDGKDAKEAEQSQDSPLTSPELMQLQQQQQQLSIQQQHNLTQYNQHLQNIRSLSSLQCHLLCVLAYVKLCLGETRLALMKTDEVLFVADALEASANLCASTAPGSSTQQQSSSTSSSSSSSANTSGPMASSSSSSSSSSPLSLSLPRVPLPVRLFALLIRADALSCLGDTAKAQQTLETVARLNYQKKSRKKAKKRKEQENKTEAVGAEEQKRDVSANEKILNEKAEPKKHPKQKNDQSPIRKANEDASADTENIIETLKITDRKEDLCALLKQKMPTVMPNGSTLIERKKFERNKATKERLKMEKENELIKHFTSTDFEAVDPSDLESVAFDISPSFHFLSSFLASTPLATNTYANTNTNSWQQASFVRTEDPSSAFWCSAEQQTGRLRSLTELHEETVRIIQQQQQQHQQKTKKTPNESQPDDKGEEMNIFKQPIFPSELSFASSSLSSSLSKSSSPAPPTSDCYALLDPNLPFPPASSALTLVSPLKMPATSIVHSNLDAIKLNEQINSSSLCLSDQKSKRKMSEKDVAIELGDRKAQKSSLISSKSACRDEKTRSDMRAKGFSPGSLTSSPSSSSSSSSSSNKKERVKPTLRSLLSSASLQDTNTELSMAPFNHLSTTSSSLPKSLSSSSTINSTPHLPSFANFTDSSFRRCISKRTPYSTLLSSSQRQLPHRCQ
ncbi:uncharacterized protein MONOS_1124 [Monocercomonoides exilis]|uniref:uncharacterized protein n=1 Tax=Monocercomonoides exilis TaxID=2049356 RepID=UPI003559A003|nr:hypothetical protein MONOS_1124 [Monocercomonoides exilis]|eukprot:MONOS_1124.1-p1 / transcript=MONOS_1124.1 / gene=MONOS_1124 / organism=Monocercomonoides_exilis_PA203 / gene_product=unspecified product / transcript_product=unspecified product / location=Mono_scaffold00019:55670-60505(-) / protein_length=1612 / sequence_SO=supercontig / SO=protein_coding / is_pseudo=false